MANISFGYAKGRKEFGRPCYFTEKQAEILIDIPSTDEFDQDFTEVELQNRGTQYAPIFSEHEMNTERIVSEFRGMNHAEGGWPKDVNPHENEQTARFRKKAEKEENYMFTVLRLAESMEHIILQNNALNIYEDYFSDVVQVETEKPPRARSLNVFRDPASVNKRTVTRISFNPENDQKMAASYSNTIFQSSKWSDFLDSYIWDVEFPQKPEMPIRAKSHIVTMEYNPKDGHIIVGGCFNGQVAFWDDRRGSTPVETTTPEFSHKEPVYNALWILSKSGTECFTSATDGVVNWWDIRKLSEPLETLILDVTKKPEIDRNRAHGALCMEFEPTMQTKFLIGTEQGSIILGNRKGKLPQDKLGNIYLRGHSGPIYTIQRNPFGLKNFLTIGDYTARIYSEDVKEVSIIWTKQSQYPLLNGCWNHTRPSVFFAVSSVGTVEAWDLLFKQKEPTLSMKVADEALRSIRMHESGKIFATGSVEGAITLMEISESLYVSTKQEKSVLLAAFEREVKREKTLDGKYREMRVKAKARPLVEDSETAEQSSYPHAEKEFRRLLNQFRTQEEKRRRKIRGIVTTGDEGEEGEGEEEGVEKAKEKIEEKPVEPPPPPPPAAAAEPAPEAEPAPAAEPAPETAAEPGAEPEQPPPAEAEPAAEPAPAAEAEAAPAPAPEAEPEQPPPPPAE